MFFFLAVSLFFFLAVSLSAFAQTTLVPATLAFGNRVLNESSAPKTATFKNTQATPITISAITVGGGSAPGDYEAGGNCPMIPNTLGAGKSCRVTIVFTPTSLGSRTATLTVTHDASTSPQSVALTGTGVAPVTLTHASLNLGNVAVGNVSAAKLVTLTNHLSVTLTFSSIAAGGDFAIVGNTCGGSIAAGAKCTVSVTLSPTGLGAQSGVLMFNDSAANSPQTVNLTGTGITPVTVARASLVFSSRVGTTSPAKNVTVTNHLTSSLSIATITASGDFAVASNSCGSSVGPGLKCTVGVTFTPTAVGARSGTLSIPFSAFGSPILVNLSGTGNVTGLKSIAVTPANSSIALGSTQKFVATGTFTNSGTQDLTSSVSWSSTVASVATINAAGLATTVGQGHTTIEAKLGAINGVTTLTVTAQPGGSFTPTGGLNTGRGQHTATLLDNGLALIVGGVDTTGTALASAELYDPGTGGFTFTGSLNEARRLQTATLLANGMVLVAGGDGGNGSRSASAELYNPATATFTPTAGLNTPRYVCTATLLNNGAVLIVGGIDSSGTALGSAELYDPGTGAFTVTGSLNTERYYHTATLLNNGTVLIAGGSDLGGSAVAGAELYDPATGVFAPTGSLNAPRMLHTAALLNTGVVLIAGGFGPGNSAGAELYDPATGTFTLTGSLPTARSEHTATLLSNGRVLIAGGSGAGQPGGSAELYDSATGTFSLTGSLNTPRFGHTATLLNNGSVLVVGSDESGGSSSASAELFNPDTLTPAELVSIEVTPAAPAIAPGTTQQFLAIGTFGDGSSQILQSAQWSSSSEAVATISNDATDHGRALALTTGTATITATAGVISGTATLTVANSTSCQPPAGGVTGTNGNDTLFFQGMVQQVTATITNDYSGETVAINDLYNANTTTYNGLGGRDTLLMTNVADFLSLVDAAGQCVLSGVENVTAGPGNDIVNLASTQYLLGDTTLTGSLGNDIIWANAGSDLVQGNDGNDVLDGGPGKDVVNGGNGDDTVDGGAGSDVVTGDAGNDTLVYTLSQNIGATDHYDGGTGTDTLVLHLTAAQANAVAADIAAAQAFMAAHYDDTSSTGPSFAFASFGLTFSNIENLQVLITGP